MRHMVQDRLVGVSRRGGELDEYLIPKQMGGVGGILRFCKASFKSLVEEVL